MNEFIIWDNKNKIFIEDKYESFALTSKGNLVEDNYCFENCNRTYGDRFSIFSYIGKKDIRDRKIYENCSIVEFKYTNKALRGYFKFDELRLKYYIILLSQETLEFDPYNILNIKIIDTLQQNKLGLIK